MYFYVVVLHENLLLFRRSCFRRRCLAPNLNRFLKYLSEDLFRHRPSQQPIWSQIMRICMGIYRKIDKTVKMFINSYQIFIPHKKLCLCCFLTVSCPHSLRTTDVSRWNVPQRRWARRNVRRSQATVLSIKAGAVLASFNVVLKRRLYGREQ